MNEYETITPQQPFEELGDLAVQIFEAPYEPARDIEALAQYQANQGVITVKSMVDATALTVVLGMLAKAMRIAVG